MRITSLKAIKYSVWMCVDYTFITILLLYLWDQRKNRVLLILSLIPTPKWPGFFWAPPPFLVICCIFHIFTWICKEIIDLRWSFVHPLLPFNMPLFTQSWFVFKNYFQLKFSPPHSYLNVFDSLPLIPNIRKHSLTLCKQTHVIQHYSQEDNETLILHVVSIVCCVLAWLKKLNKLERFERYNICWMAWSRLEYRHKI